MRTSFFHALRTGALSLGLTLGAAGLAGAQTDGDRGGASGPGAGSGGATNNAPARTGTADNRDDRGVNPGYAGLLGLLGLAGLIPLFTRRDHDVRRDNRTHPTTTTGRGL
jgi:hypothetical protein